MHTDFLAYVRAQLAAVKPVEFARIALESGVPESTIRKLHYGEVLNPRIGTVQALHNFFYSKRPQKRHAQRVAA